MGRSNSPPVNAGARRYRAALDRDGPESAFPDPAAGAGRLHNRADLFGTPLAVWLSFTRWRKFFAESVVTLPLVLPPTVLGFYVLVALGSNSPMGPFVNSS
jgi:hypothetical protein